MGSAADFAAKITAGDANLDRLDSAVNDAPGTWLTKDGTVVTNLRRRLEEVGLTPPVLFEAGISVSSVKTTVSYDGGVYLSNGSDIPFVTTGTFDPTQWVLLFSNDGTVGLDGVLLSLIHI